MIDDHGRVWPMVVALANSLEASSINVASSKSSIDRVPPEILYDILGNVVADYIDQAITDLNPKTREEEPEIYPQNRIVPLLHTSFCFRETTLKILADGLGSQIITGDSLLDNLWNCITSTRKLYRLAQTPTLSSHAFLSDFGVGSDQPLVLAYFGLCGARIHLHSLSLESSPQDTFYSFHSAFSEKMGRILRSVRLVFIVKQRVLRERVQSRAGELLIYATVVSRMWASSGFIQRACSLFRRLPENDPTRKEVTETIFQELVFLKNIEVELQGHIDATTKTFNNLCTQPLINKEVIEESGVLSALNIIQEAAEIVDDPRIENEATRLLCNWESLLQEHDAEQADPTAVA